MRENLIKTAKNIEWETLTDIISKEVQKVYKDSYLNPSFQGWVHKIILEEDGNLYITGAMSNGTSTVYLDEGDSALLEIIDAWHEVDYELQFDDLNILNDKEKQELLEHIIEWHLDEEDKEEILEDSNEITLESVYDFDASILETTLIDKFQDKYDELLENYIEACWDVYAYDNICDSIYYTLEKLRDEEV